MGYRELIEIIRDWTDKVEVIWMIMMKGLVRRTGFEPAIGPVLTHYWLRLSEINCIMLNSKTLNQNQII